MTKPHILVVAVTVAAIAAAALYTLWQSRAIADAYPPAGTFAETDGLRLHLTDTRPEGKEKAALVLIHGASGNEREMRAALGDKLISRGFRVVSIDRPGHGWSERGGDAARNDPAGQARTIRAALEKHGLRNAIVVVHSLAGALGLQLALDHADFARGVVLISPVTHPWPGGIALYYTLAASQAGGLFNHTLALPAGQALLRPALNSVFAPQVPPADYLARTGVELVLRPDNFAANARDVAGLYDFVTRQAPRYPNIDVPVAIVAGDADRIVLTHIHSRNSASAIPGATLDILPGAGHAPHCTHPQAVLNAIESVHARTGSASEQAAR